MALSTGFVGQRQVVEQLQLAIDASKAKGKIMDHVLLIAPPGVGKTHLGRRIAWELQAPLLPITFPGQSHLFMRGLSYHAGVVLLDEIHHMKRKEFDVMIPFMDNHEIQRGRITRFNDRITIVAATTDPQGLPDAFVSRFPIRPDFEDYSVEEICEIIASQAFGIPEDDIKGLASASLGSPRQALQLARKYDDIRAVRDDVSAAEVLEHMNITPDGLRRDHIKYLTNLAAQDGRASGATLAKMSFMPEGSLKWVERDLLRLGIISISSAGRELLHDDWRDHTSEQEVVDNDDAPVNPYTLEPN